MIVFVTALPGNMAVHSIYWDDNLSNHGLASRHSGDRTSAPKLAALLSPTQTVASTWPPQPHCLSWLYHQSAHLPTAQYHIEGMSVEPTYRRDK